MDSFLFIVRDNMLFPFLLCVQGFDHHINAEHCVWSYIFFFIHLDDTKQSDYTALELYVFKLVRFNTYIAGETYNDIMENLSNSQTKYGPGLIPVILRG